LSPDADARLSRTLSREPRGPSGAGAEDASRPARVSRFAPDALLVLAAVGSSLLVWWPFLGRMSLIYRHWDAPAYLAIAREGYAAGGPLAPGTGTPWLLAHLPLYPLLTRLLSFVGWERATLVGSVLCTVAAVLIFYRLARDVWKVPSPWFLSLVFVFVPPRWLLYHSVGASEPLFLALALGSIWCFERDRIGWACFTAGLAAVTRVSGILFFPAYALLLLARGRRRSLPWLLWIPAGFGAYLAYCQIRFGTFMAPFEPNLDKLASPIPFAFLGWLIGINRIAHAEFHIYLAAIYAVGISRLRRFPVPMAFAAFQLAFYLFISSEDWSRYFLVMAPFALLLGFHDILTSRPVRWMLPVYVLVATFYARSAIPKNLCPAPLYERLLQHLGV